MMEDREVLIKESVLEDIGDAIQEKTKSSKKFLPDQLGDQIRGIGQETWFRGTHDFYGENFNMDFFPVKVGD